MVMRTQKEVRQRAPLWLAGLLALNIGLISYDARDEVTKQRVVRAWAQAAASVFQRPVSLIGGAGVGFFHHLINLRGAIAENERLKTSLAELEAELRAARMARDENEQLRGLLALKEDVQYAIVPARVIARDPSAWFNTVIINRGSLSGVDTYMPVVTRAGIVGYIVAVSPVTAQIMLITDVKAGAGAVVGQLGASNALGSVRGYGKNGLLEMRYVSGLETVKEGDEVFTTGQDGIYPPGLNVGQVVEVAPGTTTAPHTIRLRPSAQLNSLDEVAVLLYRPPQRVAPSKTLPNVDKGKK